MRPLPGMSVIGKYPLRFDADLAVAMLGDTGIEGVVIGDASSESAGFGRVDGFAVAVRNEIAKDAQVVLTHDQTEDREGDALDRAYHHRSFADRPTWVRYSTYSVLAALAGPATIAALFQAWWLLDSFFP
ncbi:MAG: hypothetical protein HOH36_06795 [Acidimicrobiaceae bacterium]|nr:hypothetical protein [Acidimicrobiaceae bacterium]MBT5579335.1 hypothetical protein [Acidimicrobiaceae bacterium]MBT5850125.1 hypothetical protein [Acidimicrobiaceae bacterium]